MARSKCTHTYIQYIYSGVQNCTLVQDFGRYTLLHSNGAAMYLKGLNNRDPMLATADKDSHKLFGSKSIQQQTAVRGFE